MLHLYDILNFQKNESAVSQQKMTGISMYRVSRRSEAEAYPSLKNSGLNEEYDSSTNSSFCDGCRKAKVTDDLETESRWQH